MDDKRRRAAEKEAAAQRALDPQVRADAERLVVDWNERQAKCMPPLFSPTIGAAISALRSQFGVPRPWYNQPAPRHILPGSIRCIRLSRDWHTERVIAVPPDFTTPDQSSAASAPQPSTIADTLREFAAGIVADPLNRKGWSAALSPEGVASARAAADRVSAP
jgi:hypothetical protein